MHGVNHVAGNSQKEVITYLDNGSSIDIGRKADINALPGFCPWFQRLHLSIETRRLPGSI
jgi:hypothetical protein